jgi:cyclic-di-AMP phosphodiesterase PgpH
MPVTKARKTRSSRASELKPTSAPIEFVQHLFGNRHALLRLGIALLAVLIVAIVVEGWRTPFTYRLGQVHDDGVTARIDFAVPDDFATAQKRIEREDAEPFVFHHDPEPIKNLPPKLDSALKHVANAATLADLPDDTRAAFGLTTAAAESNAADTGRGFETLKQFVSGMGNALQVDEIINEFDTFLGPLRATGVADPRKLDEIGIRSDQTLLIVFPGGGSERVARDEVNPSQMIKDSGKLGKNWNTVPKLASIRPHVERWLLSQVPFTLEYDVEATLAARRQAREKVAPVTEPYARGTVLVQPGVPVDDTSLAVLKAEYAQLQTAVPVWYRVTRLLIVVGLLVVLAGLNGYYLWRNERQIVADAGRLCGFVLAVVAAIAIGRGLSIDPWRAEVIPLIAAVMVLAIAYNQVLAAMTAFSIVLVVSLSTVMQFEQFVVLMAVCSTAVIGLGNVSSRSTIIKVGFATAAVYLVVSVGTNLLATSLTWEVHAGRLIEAFRGAGWCILAGYLVAGSLPFVESRFGVVTDISLLEMSDVSHPLLQELVQRAPGTYNHSMTVATIGEAAADRIGANGLLVRVGAYFHDIGKMLKPEYFIENQSHGAGNRHDQLAPAMSTLIIIGHVKDGVELARQHNLPQRLVDFIEQHHGTTLVEYFYREAARRAKEADRESDAEESSFRYPGPKPQSKEAAVMMLADAVESASRTLNEPTPKRLEGLVQDLTMKRLLDGQFDESPLKLNEIHAVQESLVKSLIGIYHGRIKYPEQRTA